MVNRTNFGFLRIEYTLWHFMVAKGSWQSNGPGYSISGEIVRIEFPAWFLFLLTSIWPVIAAIRWGRNRRLPGHCPACGYDLRGSKQSTTCPECGEAIPKLTATDSPEANSGSDARS